MQASPAPIGRRNQPPRDPQNKCSKAR